MKNLVYIRSTTIYNDSRATKEITAYLKKGLHVHLIMWDRNGKGETNCKKVFSSFMSSLTIYSFPYQLRNGIGFKNIGLLLKWFSFIKKTIQNIDSIKYIHSCDLECGLPVISFCKKKKIKLIYDIYDYYVDSHSIPFLLRNVIERKEIKVINNSNYTIICTEERREQIRKAKPQNVLVIYNTVDISEESYKNSKIEYDYAYCGGLSNIRLVDKILDNYFENKDLKFIFAGYGECEQKAINLTKEKNFTFAGSISYNDVIEIEEKSLCLSAIYDPSFRNHKLCAPNKFYEALALGKPIIVCKGTGIDEIVKKYDIGLVIDYNVEQFYSAVRLLKSNKNKYDSLSRNAKKLYHLFYEWNISEKKLLSIID